MPGIIGYAGGIGGFYLPVLMGAFHERTESYASGFLIIAGLTTTATLCILIFGPAWIQWALPHALAASAQENPETVNTTDNANAFSN